MRHFFNSKLQVKNREYEYCDLEKAAKEFGADLKKIPYSIRVVLENVIRNCKSEEELRVNASNALNWKENIDSEIEFYPSRILLQDYTGVPCIVDLASMRDAAVKLGLKESEINPEIPVDLIIDHSVQIDMAGTDLAAIGNTRLEFERNMERYQMLKWAQKEFSNLRVVPPDTGIVHQINIEYLSPVVIEKKIENTLFLQPDSVFGTDSHTTMINGLGVLGWGVGGIEAEACMLGEPSVFPMPEVIGVRLINRMPVGVVATDLALKITNVLRENHVVGKFVEYFGEGYESLSLADRATIANMAPEYGSTCGYCPPDTETLRYLELTGRDSEEIEKISAYLKANHLFYDSNDTVEYSEVIEVDLSHLMTSLSGPKRPQDLVPMDQLAAAFERAIVSPMGNQGFGLEEDELEKEYAFELDGKQDILKTGDVLIAAITSCTNTSNPTVLFGAALMAKKAVEKGLTVSPRVKTSFAPGSQAVTRYLESSGLIPYLEKLGFHIVAYGCTTCIGNSGPLKPEIETALKASDLVCGAVLSGNRNFEGRIHPLIKANYLGSPMLVIAYALAGNLRKNLMLDPIGVNAEGEKVYLKDIWPTTEEIDRQVRNHVTSESYRAAYDEVYSGNQRWNDIAITGSHTYNWDENSTYIANPPYFDDLTAGKTTAADLNKLKVLAKLGDSVTTDHISPAGAIAVNSAAGAYLQEHGVEQKDFNSYGSRRGNHHVMLRGTLANTRLHNELADGKEGSFTRYLPTGEIMSIYDASYRYQQNGTGLLILAGKDYGMGSSRDWAAKGVKLLGVKTVIAESYERIHRSNLVMMGVLPLEYLPNQTAVTLGLTGEEEFTVHLPVNPGVREHVQITAKRLDGRSLEFEAVVRFDSEADIRYYQNDGILPMILKEKSRVD
ncbi:aconitate hydratase AcnA [Kineothrix sp. MB12-C1]|uniref:aconitate hydratase AcnA n=1 Tax=Kineothrix sp. MB12-C1 TaxID=3070215 RepID=UPI0027D1F21C|nr:aconitate hydratase AcnA [Kineothrix sp. MB12-C1]WMC92551.1 aconitate hydratase AcnA [Kineothrix sp. MB12-C1]